MIIKKISDKFNTMIPLPTGGWLTYFSDVNEYYIIKITPAGEIIRVGTGNIGFLGSIGKYTAFGWNGNEQFGLNDRGEPVYPYSEINTLRFTSSEKYDTEIIAKDRSKIVCSLLGIETGEVGIGLRNRTTKESKLLVVHKGVFGRRYERYLNITVSYDEMTAIVWQARETNSNFVIVDIDI